MWIQKIKTPLIESFHLLPTITSNFCKNLEKNNIKRTLKQSTQDYNKLVKKIKSDGKRRSGLSESEKEKFDELQSKNIEARKKYKNTYGEDPECEDLLEL